MAGSPENVRIPIQARVLRNLAAITTSFPFRAEVQKPQSEGWKRAEELNREGYGIVIAHMHANKGDAPRVIRRIFESSTLGKRDILLPNSAHQYKDWYIPAGAKIHVKVLPIFTPETNRLTQENPVLAKRLKGKYSVDIGDPQFSRETARYLGNYLSEAVSTLQRAGLAIVAPQGHREGMLTTMTTAVEVITMRALRQRFHNIAVLFLGYDILGVNNYNEILNSYNLFKKYQFRDGRCITIDELLAEAGGDSKKLKDVVKREMESVVPFAYLPQPHIGDGPQVY